MTSEFKVKEQKWGRFKKIFNLMELSDFSYRCGKQKKYFI